MNKNIGINIAFIFFVGAFILLSYSSIHGYFIKKNGIRAEGIVSQISTIGFTSKVQYWRNTPIVTYLSKDGRIFSIKDCDSCHKIGESVPVIYDSNNPENAVIDTKSSDFTVVYYLIGFMVLSLFYLELKKMRSSL